MLREGPVHVPLDDIVDLLLACKESGVEGGGLGDEIVDLLLACKESSGRRGQGRDEEWGRHA